MTAISWFSKALGTVLGILASVPILLFTTKKDRERIIAWCASKAEELERRKEGR